MPIAAMVRNRAETGGKFSAPYEYREEASACAPDPPQSTKTPVVTKTCSGLNRAFSLFVNALATNAA